jgi:hypothetical protein
MPHTNAAANVVYVRHLEANLSKSSNSCRPPRGPLTPGKAAHRQVFIDSCQSDDEDVGMAAAVAFAIVTLLTSGIVFWLAGRWLGVL